MEESEIRALLDRRCEAVGLKDIDRLVSHYSPDAVYFDVVPPLRYSGSAALRRRFSEWLGAYQGAVKQEIYEFNARISGDIAVVAMLIQSAGMLRGRSEAIGLWVRSTTCFQRANGTWLITHEHVSVPADLKSGRALWTLNPDTPDSAVDVAV